MIDLYIVGMGPGNPDYLLPLAVKVIDRADVLIGGRRHLESYEGTQKILVPLKGGYEPLIRDSLERYKGYSIAILVSGDPGYHSPLRLIRESLSDLRLQVIPGLSSFQYLFTKVGLPWQGAQLISMHGNSPQRWTDLLNEQMSVLLLDTKTSPGKIAHYLCSQGRGDRELIIGYDLSYEFETIVKMKASEVLMEDYRICVMILL